MHPKLSRAECAQPQTIAFVAPLGGVMTREVGTISGEVEAWLVPDQPGLVGIRYVGAEEDYTVAGAAPGLSLEQVVARLTVDLGVDEDGNPRFTDLDG